MSKKELAKLAVAAILAASLIATFFYLTPSIQDSSSSKTGPNNSVTYVGPISLEFVGNDSAEATAATGSTVHGTITINILKEVSLRFYVDDRGYNTTLFTLPTGISISLSINGNTYDPPLLSSAVNPPPLVPTAQGETAVQYAMSVANSASAGVCVIRILCLSFSNNGTLTDPGIDYRVTLNVQ